MINWSVDHLINSIHVKLKKIDWLMVNWLINWLMANYLIDWFISWLIDWSAAEPGVEDTVYADTNGPRPPTNYPQTYKSWSY